MRLKSQLDYGANIHLTIVNYSHIQMDFELNAYKIILDFKIYSLTPRYSQCLNFFHRIEGSFSQRLNAVVIKRQQADGNQISEGIFSYAGNFVCIQQSGT